MTDRFDHLFIAPEDFDRSLGFYRDLLGWQVLHQWGEAGSSPRGAVLKSEGGMSVVLAEEHADEQDDAWSQGRQGAQPTVHLNVDDLEARFARLKEAGDRVVVEPQQTHWGTRWFVLKDPDGNLLAFDQPQQQG